MRQCASYFSHFCDEQPGRRNLTDSQFKGTVHHGKAQQLGQEVSGHMTSTVGKQKYGSWYSASFLLFIQSGTLAHGMVPPTFRVGPPTSINSVYKLPH